jgi:hypothetical protein
MFDRAARAAWRVSAAPYVEIAVLTPLAALLQDVTSVSGAPSQLRDSKISLHKSNIERQHRPIFDQPTADWICDRDSRISQRGPVELAEMLVTAAALQQHGVDTSYSDGPSFRTVSAR